MPESVLCMYSLLSKHTDAAYCQLSMLLLQAAAHELSPSDLPAEQHRLPHPRFAMRFRLAEQRDTLPARHTAD